VVVSLIGGVGLFLLGMMLLSDGLKSFAGDSLRRALLRFTAKPRHAFATGALVTALVQSSSATTLTTIGFVSAGLLGFNQAVGLVMGASLGTTSTAWLVSLFGLKFSIVNIALPLIGCATFVRLLARGRLASLGLAVAGFGLIFVGIDLLQKGMAGLTEKVDLSVLPTGGLSGHLIMMGIGIVLTILMQSSSAAVATTLTALHSGAIGFEQAAPLVIGAAIGTTVSAGMAAIGASVGAKRTALAHVLFNLFTGLVAVLLLPWFLLGLTWAQQNLGLDRGAVSLAAFHTSFIAIGVLIFLPFIRPFSRMIERMLPEKGPRLTRHLDPSVLKIPAVAMEAVRGCLRESAVLLFELLEERLVDHAPDRHTEESALQINTAMREVSEFISRIPQIEYEVPGTHLRRDSFHAIDHLTQLLPCATQQHLPVQTETLGEAAADCRRSLAAARRFLTNAAGMDLDPAAPEYFERTSTALAAWRKAERLKLLESPAAAGLRARESIKLLDTIRWIDMIAYHSWRIAFYLQPKN